MKGAYVHTAIYLFKFNLGDLGVNDFKSTIRNNLNVNYLINIIFGIGKNTVLCADLILMD